jgi:homoserine dehydrogenase
VKSLRLGLLGFGTVGRALVRLLEKEAPRLRGRLGLDVRVVAIGNRRIAEKKAGGAGTGVRWTDDLASVVADPGVDLVVELLGGAEPAGSLVRAALETGKGVVTANKLLLAREGSALAALAEKSGAALGIEAAVAGGIPILRALRESFAGDSVRAVRGILNGTCNFILTEMARSGRSYGEILGDAQRLGYAEADPASDVEGHDAAYKLTLLARMAFGRDVRVEQVSRQGITALQACDVVYARMLGRTLRQIAEARQLPDGRLHLSVRTHLVSDGSILAKVDGPFNLVEVEGENGGLFAFHGRGAGGDPTATAVLADVVEIARSGHRAGVPPFGSDGKAPFAPAGPADHVAPFYLRFVVADRPGILAGLTAALARHDVNVDAVLQVPYRDKDALPFVVTLEPVDEARLGLALVELAALPFHREPPLVLPMTL